MVLTYQFHFLSLLLGEDGPNPVIPHLENLINNKVDEEKILVSVKKRFYDLIKLLPLRPGVAEYLDTARELGFKNGNCIQCESFSNYANYPAFGIQGYFDWILTKDDVLKAKPDPEMIKMALSKMGLSPSKVIAFDDTNVGLTGARQKFIVLGLPMR